MISWSGRGKLIASPFDGIRSDKDVGTLGEKGGRAGRAISWRQFVYPARRKTLNRGSAKAVATGESSCDEPIYGLDNWLYLLRVCRVIVGPRGVYMFEFIPAGLVKGDGNLPRRRTVLDEFKNPPFPGDGINSFDG